MTKPTKKRKDQIETKCTGNYCDELFWNQNITEIKKLEEEEGNWIDINNFSIKGDYLPNEKDQTCGIFTKTGYIVGGEDAKIGEFPFLAALGKCVFLHSYHIQSLIISFNGN